MTVLREQECQSSIYHVMIDLVFDPETAKYLEEFSCADIFTTDNHISVPGEFDQPQPISKSFAMESEFSNCCAKDIFFVHPDVKIARPFQSFIKGNFGHIVLLFQSLDG